MEAEGRTEAEFDLAEVTLRLSPVRIPGRLRGSALRRIEGYARSVRETLPHSASPHHALEAVSNLLSDREGFTGTLSVTDPRSLSLAHLLEEKRGTCVSLVILYLAVAERAGVPVSAAATPEHLFVRYEGPGGPLNVETLEGGRFLDDETYRRRYRMAESSIERGIFMRPLPKKAVLAHFLSNRGVLAAREGRHRAAMRDFRRALALYPDLVAGYYNRGLERLRGGDYEKAREDFSAAIDRHPLDAQAFNNRGLSHLRLGEREAARHDFEDALRIEPGLKEATQNLRLLTEGDAKRPEGGRVPR